MNNQKNTLYTRGAALILFVVFFLAASLVLVLTIGRGAYDDLITYRMLESGKQSFFAAEAGIEDAVFRHKEGDNYSDTESFIVGTTSVSMVRTLVGDHYEIVATGDSGTAIRKSYIEIVMGDGVTFSFGMQSGTGGIEFFNSSSVVGNIFSNGSIRGTGNFVYGDAITAGPTGLIDSIHATGSVWSHSLNNVTVDKDAHYFSAGTRVATVVSGTPYPGSIDQNNAPFPIQDSKIEEWKTTIETTGTVIASTSPQCSSGTYTINSDTTLNNVKIECNVIFKKQGASTVITIAGAVWIVGNLDINAGPTIVASSSLGSNSIALIVDNESNRLTSSKVTINQSTSFSSGNSNSYIVVISMNNSSETGGSETAITINQSASGKIIVYASHGLINVSQSMSLKEITAHKIELHNTAKVIYESGNANLLFSTGPGGGYIIDSWKETI